MALIPVFFAAQQFAEGLVWHGLSHDDASLVEGASVAYLFFAMAFWPFWMPLCFACSEKRRATAWLLGTMTFVSLAWTWLYLPIFLTPHESLTTKIVQHSIRYAPGALPGYDLAPPWAWRSGYLMLVAVPVLISCFRKQTHRSDTVASSLGAVALLASFALCYYLYWEVFVSLWCFLAAVLSLMLCYIFHRLPEASHVPQPVWDSAAAIGAAAQTDDWVIHRQPQSFRQNGSA
jgi:hypothetical protein